MAGRGLVNMVNMKDIRGIEEQCLRHSSRETDRRSFYDLNSKNCHPEDKKCKFRLTFSFRRRRQAYSVIFQIDNNLSDIG